MTHNFINNIFHPDTRELLYSKCTHCSARDNDEVALYAPCRNAPAANAGTVYHYLFLSHYFLFLSASFL